MEKQGFVSGAYGKKPSLKPVPPAYPEIKMPEKCVVRSCVEHE
jgi:hypothetical protein